MAVANKPMNGPYSPFRGYNRWVNSSVCMVMSFTAVPMPMVMVVLMVGHILLFSLNPFRKQTTLYIMLNRLFITLIFNETLLNQQEELLINYIYLASICDIHKMATTTDII
jgi:hypothetical protein